jgi:hypothetical protein
MSANAGGAQRHGMRRQPIYRAELEHVRSEEGRRLRETQRTQLAFGRGALARPSLAPRPRSPTRSLATPSKAPPPLAPWDLAVVDHSPKEPSEGILPWSRPRKFRCVDDPSVGFRSH